MNNLYVIKNVYWIIKNTGNKKTPLLSRGFMRQTAAPWLTGNGVQLRVGKYVFQFGFCGKPKDLDDTNGLLYAIQGREMEETPRDIRGWK